MTKRFFPPACMVPLTTLALAALTLTGCEFTDGKGPPLKGERISILQLQSDLAPDPALKALPYALPDAWTNQFWPQAGGYPNHSMGHLVLNAPLTRAWDSPIGTGGSRRAPLTAAPVVAEGKVFALDTRGRVTALDMKTGRKVWQISSAPAGEKDSGAVGGGLAYAAGRLYVTNGYKYLLALQPETGVALWRAQLAAPARAAPTVADDRIFILTLDNSLSVFNVADGTPLWSRTGVSEATNLLGSAAVAVDRTLAVQPMSSGEIFGLRPENGQVVWQDNLSAVRKTGVLSSLADIRGLPVIDQGTVYAVSYSGRLVALDQVTGQRRWQREIGSAETPVVAGDHIFLITTEQQLVALNRATGGLRWVSALPRYRDKDGKDPLVWTGPVLAGGRLIVASNHGRLREINPQDGTQVNDMKLPGDVTLPPIVAGGMLFILTNDGRLAAYR